MPLKENVLAALKMYYDRLNQLQEVLQEEVVNGIVDLASGTCTEEELSQRLLSVHNEVSEIKECVALLTHLYHED